MKSCWKASLTAAALGVADVIADSVADEAKIVSTEVEKSVKRTRTAAKRTGTTAKNAA